jgi:urease accessory protein
MTLLLCSDGAGKDLEATPERLMPSEGHEQSQHRSPRIDAPLVLPDDRAGRSAARRDISRAGPGAPQGVARIAFAARDGITHLAQLFQKTPLRVLRPIPAPGEPPCAVLANTGGGIVGGDALQVRVRLGTGATALITSQAAEKVYRSAGADATVDVGLELADQAWLEWLPQETILFDQARLRRTLRVDATPQARLMAADMIVFGRRARGERFATGLFRDRWEVRVGGRLVWADALHLTEPGALLDAPFAFAGAAALATCIYLAPDAKQRIGLARGLAESPDVRSGATNLGPLLIVRWLAADPAPLRRALQRFCARFRHAVAGLPERVPAIWRT